jgi:hypothetical protein
VLVEPGVVDAAVVNRIILEIGRRRVWTHVHNGGRVFASNAAAVFPRHKEYFQVDESDDGQGKDVEKDGAEPSE